jgi:predicted transcriptional regulator YdeE
MKTRQDEKNKDIQDITLNVYELEEIYFAALEGKISKNDLAETQKLQLIQLAQTKINNKKDSILNLINLNILSLDNIGGDIDLYISTQIRQEKCIIDWLSVKKITAKSKTKR